MTFAEWTRRRARRTPRPTAPGWRPRLVELEDRITPATLVWTGAVDGNWSTNNNGQTDQVSHQVTVDSAPTAAFSPPTGIQQAGVPAPFDASASTAIAGGSIAE